MTFEPQIQTSRVTLIPFDPDSLDHAERLHNHRIACGWNHHQIDRFRDLQRQGIKGIHWITISPDLSNYQTLISQHLSRYPEESKPLADTAKTLFGKPRAIPATVDEDSPLEFIPIGHISIDLTHAYPELANPTDNIYAVTLFYVSWALQSSGLGSASMSATEKIAANLLNAKALALSAIARETHYDQKMWDALARKNRQTVCNQDWYEKRGYAVFKYVGNYIKETDRTGKVWEMPFVFLKKDLSGMVENRALIEIPVVPTPAL